MTDFRVENPNAASISSFSTRIPLNTSSTPMSPSMVAGSPTDSPFFFDWAIPSFANTATAFTLQGYFKNGTNVSSAVKHGGGVFGYYEDTSTGALVFGIGTEGYALGKGSSTYAGVVGHGVFVGASYTATVTSAFMSSVEIFQADGSTPLTSGLAIAYYAPAITGGGAATKFSFLGSDPMKVINTIYSFDSGNAKSISLRHDGSNGYLEVSSGAIIFNAGASGILLIGAFFAPLTANSCSIGANGFEISDIWQAGRIVKYNNILTVSNGVSSELATIDLTAQTANKAASTLYAVPSSGAGMYRVSAYIVETTAASVSSTLPNLQIVYTDNDSNTSITLDATPVLGVAGIGQSGALTSNTIGTVVSGVISINVKASTTIQYQTVNYASTAAGMAYALHIKLEVM